MGTFNFRWEGKLYQNERASSLPVPLSMSASLPTQITLLQNRHTNLLFFMAREVELGESFYKGTDLQEDWRFQT